MGIAKSFKGFPTFKFEFAACFTILVFLASANVTGQSIYFIQGQPGWDQPNLRPYPTSILELDEPSRQLTEVWGLGENVKAWDIDVYSSAGLAVISEGDWSPISLHVIPVDSIDKTIQYDLSGYGKVSRYRYLEGGNGHGWFDLQCKKGDGGFPPQYEHQQIQVGDETLRNEIELRLAGPRGPYGGGTRSDVISVRMKQDGALEAVGIGFDFDGSSVPHDLVRMKDSFGWSLVANEPYYRALMSVPERHGLTEREVLIFNRNADSWSSVMIPGSETTLRPVNDWLIGVVANTDPETDYEIRKGFPSILGEDVVMVHPTSLQQLTVHLGPKSEVLWVQEDSVWYRVGSDLYTARVTNNDFVDRTLLINDPRVQYIHWAFRGRMSYED
ncbi:MAG: hypothetical protein AB1483_09155 [Candidatus Zixiibacteriota bacterium]